MFLSSSNLKARPYRYFLLLHDFINRSPFELSHSGQKVVFDYMGNASKHYTPNQFSTYHDVYEAITWMKSAEINFKHDKIVYALHHITMPHEYEHGSTSEFYHIFTGLAIISKLRTRAKTVKKEDVLLEISSLSNRTIQFDKNHILDLSVNVNPDTLSIVQSPMFRPLLKDELKYACDYVNSSVVSENISYLCNLDKYKTKIVIGENRGITTDDIKLFESIKGNFQEIKLGQRNKRKQT